MGDVPLLVISENASLERRITPSWTIWQLKSKLESVTGIPPSSQSLFLKPSGLEKIPVAAADEDATSLERFPLAPYLELHVIDTRPPGLRPNYTDTSGVEKFVLPEEDYAKKTDSVLAWKRAQKLGRFDPNAKDHEQARIDAIAEEVRARSIEVGLRCRVGGDDARRGDIMFVGPVEEIPGGPVGAPWVGVQLDEPVGKNDGSIGGKRYWGEPSELSRGVFVRPERVEVGDWPVLNDLEDMEEI